MTKLFTLDNVEERKKLVNITEYAKHWGTTRDVIYEKIQKNIITVYEVEGKPYLDIEQDPKVRQYTREPEE